MNAGKTSLVLPGLKLSNSTTSKFNHNSSFVYFHRELRVPFCSNTCEIKCEASANSDSTGNNFQKLKLEGPIQNRSLAGKTFCSVGLCTYPSSDIESHAHVEEEKVGVLLLNLGGPETLHDVQPFLYNLFSDPDIIRLPRLFRFVQRPLAQLISVLRTPKSKEGYASIGGGSPLRKTTDEQADALKSELEAKNLLANIYVAMRYWHPFTEEAAQQEQVWCLLARRQGSGNRLCLDR